MLIKHKNSVKTESMPLEGVKNAGIQWLIAEKEGAEDFYMRLVTIGVNGIIPLHQHPYVHEIYIISGEGKILLEEDEKPIEKDNFVFVEKDFVHGFKNTGDKDLIMICCINKPK